MKILYHHRTRATDAQGIHIEALCNAFRTLGHDVRMVAPLAARHKAPEPKAEDSNPSKYKNRNGSARQMMYEIAAIFYNIPAFFILMFNVILYRPDFIYERYSLFSMAGLCVARLRRIPFILEVNAPLSVEMKAYESLSFGCAAQAVEDWLCARATRTVVVSEVMKSIFVARGIPEENLVVMPNGVDRRLFDREQSGQYTRRKLGMGEGKFVVGFVGWVRPWHGVEGLVDAVATLKKKFPGICLLIVGDGPALDGIKARVTESGLQNDAIFTGPVSGEQVPELISMMDVAVQPDVTEYASPIKLFEYLAMGKAVIAVRKPNIEEVVTDGSEALLFDKGNIDQLAERLEWLYTDAELRKRLGEAGAQLIDKRSYTWTGNARKVLELVNGTT